MSLPNLLKKTLIDYGLSQTELAKHSDLSIGTINKICAMTYNPSPKTQSRIVISLGKLAGTTFAVDDIFQPK